MLLRILFLVFISIGGAQGRSWNKKPKHSLKTIQTIFGDLFDCVDMYKQPVFDHPLLKNHTLQLKPSSLPKEMKLAKFKPASFNGFNDTCPSGTVLVHRAGKQDLIESQPLRNKFRAQAVVDDLTTEGSHYAMMQTIDGQFYGAYAKMATYKLPNLQHDQSSSSAIYLFGDTKAPNNELNVIQAGWHVAPSMYNTNYPRFFIDWTSDGYDKTGCINFLCAGFVSTTNIYGPGSFIPQFSTYGGEQKYLPLLIARDSNTGNWWITYNDQLPLGYFPKELLPKMDDYANVVQMGGFVDSPLNVPSPPMGSGHPCNEGRNKAAYFIQVQFMDSSNNLYNLNPLFIVPYTDNDDYYSVADDHYVDDKDKYVFAYGGVGGF